MIKLIEISKIYRTSEIETMALDNINLEVREGSLCTSTTPIPRRTGTGCW